MIPNCVQTPQFCHQTGCSLSLLWSRWGLVSRPSSPGLGDCPGIRWFPGSKLPCQSQGPVTTAVWGCVTHRCRETLRVYLQAPRRLAQRLTRALLKDETEVEGRPKRVGTYVFTQWAHVVQHCKAIVVQLLSHVQLFVAPWTAAGRAPQPFSVSQRSLKFMSIESVTLSNHLILCHPLLLCHQSFPASGSFLRPGV